MAFGRTVELHYIDDRPEGMVTARMFNWTGQVLVVPRTQLADALGRHEMQYAGIYLLLGDQDGEPLAYVGESENVGARIRNHDVNKDWWTSAIFVTSKADELNKAHVRFLEARLIQQAKRVGRMPLSNGTAPPIPALGEAEVAKMEAFLHNLFLILPALGADLFIERARPRLAPAPVANSGPGAAPSSAADLSGAATFVMVVKKYAIRATAMLKNGEFIVEAGSSARASWEGGALNYGSSYDELRRSGVLQPQGDVCVFTQNYAFKSPSAAACIVAGRSANGTVEWKTPSGESYKEWERATLLKSSTV